MQEIKFKFETSFLASGDPLSDLQALIHEADVVWKENALLQERVSALSQSQFTLRCRLQNFAHEIDILRWKHIGQIRLGSTASEERAELRDAIRAQKDLKHEFETKENQLALLRERMKLVEESSGEMYARVEAQAKIYEATL